MTDETLYIIGIDSAPLWIIKRFHRGMRMRGFSEFIERGALTDMESTMPPMTGPSWPSIYTGVRPGRHGVPEFLRMEPNYTKSVVYYDAAVRRPFWDTLAMNGVRCLVMTPAMAVTPSSVDGVDMISGFPLPARFSSQRVKAVAKEYAFSGEPEIEADMKSGKVTLREASSIYLKSIRTRSEMRRELIETGKSGLAFTCFTETDRMQHFSMNMPDWQSYVLPLYKGISDFMEWLEHRAGEEGATVMLVSDHGAQPIREKFLMNGWLINKGYAKLRPELEASIASSGSRGTVRYAVREKLLKAVNRSGSRKVLYDKLPKSIKGMAKAAMAKTLAGASAEDYTRLHDFDYDMAGTRAFASVANCPVATIFINDGRFDSGLVVKPSDKRALKGELMKELLDIKDGDGRRVIVNVYDGDDYYEGTKLFIAPDIMAEAREGCLLDSFGYLKSGGLFIKPEMAKRGDHLRNGIFGLLSYGRELDYDRIADKKLYVYNVEPTVLKYFGMKPDNDRRYGPIF
ncbi:MAG: alkaline phosphatase family protein [Candidatus Marsarchaeota archaeon]|nr:alkaline phosphatase family protein [Candidatus Marsarchaeota archaeon]